MISLRTLSDKYLTLSKKKYSSRYLISSVKNKIYLIYQRIRIRLFTCRQLKIAVSNTTSWAGDIIKGFEGSKHNIVSIDLTASKLNAYDLIIPLTIEDIVFLDTDPDRYKNNLIPIPDIEAVKLCDSKILFNNFLLQNGYGDYIPAVGKMSGYPFILKKNIDVWGSNCHIIRNSRDNEKHIDKINSSEFFCQEIVTGNYEYATHILYLDGAIQHSLNMEYYFDNAIPIKGQESFSALTITSCPYLELFDSILKLIKYEGLCCFNYKIKDGRPLILEINPRFGGSLAPYFFSFIRHIPNIKNQR